MVDYCIQKLRKHAGTIMSAKSGDKVRNALADGFVDIARALEKLNTPVEKNIRRSCFLYSFLGSVVGIIFGFLIVMLTKLPMQ